MNVIETTIKNYLETKLTEPVYMHYPDEAPAAFYVLSKTGGTRNNQIATAVFALQSYGGSLYNSAKMSLAGVNAMLDAIELDAVGDVGLNSEYEFTDTTRKKERYQAVFVVTHYELDPDPEEEEEETPTPTPAQEETQPEDPPAGG